MYFTKFICNQPGVFSGISMTFLSYPLPPDGAFVTDAIVWPKAAVYYDDGGLPGALLEGGTDNKGLGMGYIQAVKVDTNYYDILVPSEPQFIATYELETFELLVPGAYWIAVWINTQTGVSGVPNYGDIPDELPQWVFYTLGPEGGAYTPSGPVGGYDPNTATPEDVLNSLQPVNLGYRSLGTYLSGDWELTAPSTITSVYLSTPPEPYGPQIFLYLSSI
jgi:hypothetical protein